MGAGAIAANLFQVVGRTHQKVIVAIRNENCGMKICAINFREQHALAVAALSGSIADAPLTAHRVILDRVSASTGRCVGIN